MSSDLIKDINEMHKKFGVHEWFEKNLENKDLMKTYLTFRLNMCLEELIETATAAGLHLKQNDKGEYTLVGRLNDGDSEEVVDGLIDLIVFAIGALDVFGVDAKKAWDEVHNANMAKTPGIKPGRPNKFGLPDLIKPKEWQAPSHEGNHGHLQKILS